ncbi:hypothetical protein FQN52_006711 [Onygenales sp. PD_12]|nr:hypothetical protein FQN52_006711 [Onygenales sp. PD_12]
MGSNISSEINTPFLTVTSDNHGPWVLITVYVFLILSLITIVLKAVMRRRATGLLLNDYFISLAGLLLTAQTIALTIAQKNGLGRHRAALDENAFAAYTKAYYASNILIIATLAAAKVSITSLIIAIQPPGRAVYLCYGIHALVCLWAFASILALTFQCDLPRPWTEESNTCVNQYALQISIGTFNILSDLIIIAVPVYVMFTVKIALKKRWIVSGLFACRIITPTTTLLSLLTLSPLYTTHPPSRDRPWHAVTPSIWTQIATATSIITACIPSLKTFLADIRSGLTGATISEPFELAHSGGRTRVHGTTRTANGSSSGNSLGGGFGGRMGTSSSTTKTMGSSRAWRWRGGEWKMGGDGYPFAYGRGGVGRIGKRGTEESSESVKGLTDGVIVHTVDYRVEFDGGEGLERGREERRSDSG